MPIILESPVERSAIRTVRFNTIVLRSARETYIHEIKTPLDYVRYKCVVATRATPDVHAVVSDLVTIFSDWNLLRHVADAAIFRNRTSPVYQSGRDMYNVLELALIAFTELKGGMVLKTMNVSIAGHVVAAVVAHAAAAFGITQMPSPLMYGADENNKGDDLHKEVIFIPTVSDMRSMIIERTLIRVFDAAAFPKPKSASDLVLKSTSFNEYLRQISQYFVRTISEADAGTTAFEMGCAYARNIIRYGAPLGVNVALLSRLVEMVNIDFDDSVGISEAPTATDLLLLEKPLRDALDELFQSRYLVSVPCAEFAQYYKRLQIKVDRSTDRYAPIFLIRNMPAHELPLVKAAVHTHTPKFQLHSLVETPRESELVGKVQGDIVLASDELIMTLALLLSERRDFFGLITNVSEKELKALAYCLALEVQFSPGSEAPTYVFRGPFITEQLMPIMDDSPSFENSTAEAAVVAAFAEYGNFGMKVLPHELALIDALSGNKGAVEVFAQKDWTVVSTSGFEKTDIVGQYAKYVPNGEVSADGSVVKETMIDFNGTVSLNAAAGIESSYPIKLIRPEWAKAVDNTRAALVLGMLAIANGDRDLYSKSGMRVVSLGDPTAVGDGGNVDDTDTLFAQWPTERGRVGVVRAMREAFYPGILRSVSSSTVSRATLTAMRTATPRGRDYLPMNVEQAHAYAEVRTRVVVALSALAYGKMSAQALLAQAVMKDPEMMQWLASKVLLESFKRMGRS